MMIVLLIMSCMFMQGNTFKSATLVPSKMVSVTGRPSRFQSRTPGADYQVSEAQMMNQLRRSHMILFSNLPSADKDNMGGYNKDLIHVSSSSPLLERVQRGIARLAQIIPKPILVTVVAVTSGLLFFELSKTLMLLAIPVIVVLGERIDRGSDRGNSQKRILLHNCIPMDAICDIAVLLH